MLTIVFYGFRHPWWLVPFFICIGFDFLWASRLSKETNPQNRRWLLVISIAQNIGLLAIYKYWSAIEWILGWASPELPKLAAHYVFFGDEVMLPAGISFYTFESMSFVIDVYRGHVTPPKKPSEFFAFIGMFPRFIAGPIVRYRDMVDQFSCYRGMDVSIGLSLFAIGLFLKSCLADSFAVFVPLAYRVDGVVGPLASWLGVVAYGMQIYFDFSGYSLMAIGLGRCFGFQFPTNFNKPYLCSSLSDFWARWHISFTSWIRDYLFTPMAMAAMRRSKFHFALAVVATVMLSGLWHGAGWTYIIWGLWHGMFLSLERILKIRAKWPGWLHRSTALLIVFLSWVWFRSSGMGQALDIFASLFSVSQLFRPFNAEIIHSNLLSAWFCLVGFVYCFVFERYVNWIALERLSFVSIRHQITAFGMFVVAILMSFSAWSVPFLYFQF